MVKEGLEISQSSAPGRFDATALINVVLPQPSGPYKNRALTFEVGRFLANHPPNKYVSSILFNLIEAMAVFFRLL